MPSRTGPRPRASCGRSTSRISRSSVGAGSTLSAILDDFSRYIIAWKLCLTVRADDVADTLELALQSSGCNRADVVHKPRPLSDNGSPYIAGDLKQWLEAWITSAAHRELSPDPEQIECWHRTLKSRILLENDYLPGDLEVSIAILHRALQPPPLSRKLRQFDARRRLLRLAPRHLG